jgi:RNA polymerase sigma-70 factor, ECF subfamily
MSLVALHPAQHDHDGLVDATLQAEGTALLAREEGILRKVIGRYVRDEATVDDLYQEVAIKVLRRIDTVRDRATLRGWLFQLARNACLDYLRLQDRRPKGSPAPLPMAEAGGELGRNPAETYLTQERLEAIRRALASLPESQQEVIRLRLEQGMDHVGIAERLGISRQAVEVRLCRGRAALKELLEEILEGDL